jgi:hypothetical protein
MPRVWRRRPSYHWTALYKVRAWVVAVKQLRMHPDTRLCNPYDMIGQLRHINAIRCRTTRFIGVRAVLKHTAAYRLCSAAVKLLLTKLRRAFSGPSLSAWPAQQHSYSLRKWTLETECMST